MRIIFIILLLSFNASAQIGIISNQQNAVRAQAAQQTFYVATTGTGGGDGSIGSPWDFQTLLNHPAAVLPGALVWMLPGTYTGTFTNQLDGTAINPIIVRNQGRVILDGTREGEVTKYLSVLTGTGSYTWFWGLEITNTDPDRTDGIAVDSGTRGLGADILGPGNKVINCIIYDTGEGIGAWTSATNSEYYGNIIFNNGWWAEDVPAGTGHGIYTQNNTGTKTFKENIICNNFGNGWQLYGSDVSFLNNFYLEGNVCYRDRWLWGGAAPINNLVSVSNFSYDDVPELGFQSHENSGATLTNNFFASGLYLYWWENVTGNGNTIFAGHSPSSAFEIHFDGPASTPPDLSGAGLNYSFNNNTYKFPTGSTTANRPIAFYNNRLNAGDDVFWQAGWQALGQDEDITVGLYANVSNNLVLTGKDIFLRINSYDPNRANLIIYNWDQDNTVDVDVSAFLSIGNTYELRNCQNYFGDVVTGTNTTGTISVPMTGHTVALPLGYGTAQGTTTFPEFGTFVLIKTESIARDNLIVDEGFEGGDPWPSAVFNLGQDNLGEDHGGGTNTWARVQVNTGANEGASCHKTEVRSGCDGCQSQGYRSEMTLDTDVAANNTTYRYGYSVKFNTPQSGGFWTGNNAGIFAQWHPTGATGSCTVGLSNDYNENGEGITLWTNPGGFGDVTHHETGVDIVADTWYHIVMEIFWGTTGNGYVKLWINGNLEANITSLDFNTAGQYMKFGMNRWSWSGPNCAGDGCSSSSYPSNTWIISYDNLRIGNSSATYNDVAPVQILPEP